MLPPTIRGKIGQTHKLTYGINYNYGHTYLDRCGRTINAIIQAAPEWMTSDIGTQGCTLISSANGSVFSFNAAALNIVVEQSVDTGLSGEDIQIFSDQADFLTNIVVDHLNLNEFSRISLKSSFVYPARDKEESERWVLNLGAFAISDRFSEAFGAIESAAATFNFLGNDRKYRLQFNILEKQAQIDRGPNPVSIRSNTLSTEQDKAFKRRLLQKRKGITEAKFSSLIDIESYRENPLSIDSGDYIKTSFDQSTHFLANAVRL